MEGEGGRWWGWRGREKMGTGGGRNKEDGECEFEGVRRKSGEKKAKEERKVEREEKD